MRLRCLRRSQPRKELQHDYRIGDPSDWRELRGTERAARYVRPPLLPVVHVVRRPEPRAVGLHRLVPDDVAAAQARSPGRTGAATAHGGALDAVAAPFRADSATPAATAVVLLGSAGCR